MRRNWHVFGATLGVARGTVSVPHSADNLARFFVPHQSPELAPQPCQVSGTVSVPHSRTLTGELIPSCTTCKTDVPSTATIRRQPLTYRTTNATTDRARGEMKETTMAKDLGERISGLEELESKAREAFLQASPGAADYPAGYVDGIRAAVLFLKDDGSPIIHTNTSHASGLCGLNAERCLACEDEARS